MSDNTSLAVIGDGTSISLWREPEQVLAEAKKAADALISVIKQKPNKVMFNGEQYIEREDWGTVAKFYGCTAKIVQTNYVDFGGVKGFEAVAVCLDANQNEISRAESMCLSDEDSWGMVAQYDWQDKLDAEGKKIWDAKARNGKGSYIREKVKVGEKAKPLFQLRSMAQTRAEAKVLKSVFGYVVVLAGYKPTVAEEMTGNEEPRQDADPTDAGNGKKPEVKMPQKASEAVQDEVTGTISGARLSAKGDIWFHLGDKMVTVPESMVMDDEMVNGNILTVKAKKAKSEKIGEYWFATEVVKCEVVKDGTVDAEDETQADGSAEDGAAGDNPAPAQGGGKTAVAEEMAGVFDGTEGTKIKTGKEVAEETAKKKEKSWQAHVGHDPQKHISYKQGMLLFTITGKNGLNIPDETVKELLTDVFKCDGHRYLITKDDFPKVLNVLDPEFKFHEKKA